MSLKAIKEAVESLGDGGQFPTELYDRCKSEIAELEKAAKVLSDCRILSSTDVEREPVEEAAWLMERIAKEAK